MMPSVSTQSLEQLYSSLMPLNVQVLSLDWVPLIAALSPNDRSWSCLLKLKGLVFTLVAKLCLLYSYKVLRNLGFQPLSEQLDVNGKRKVNREICAVAVVVVGSGNMIWSAFQLINRYSYVVSNRQCISDGFHCLPNSIDLSLGSGMI